ncbi:ATP-binding protein [Sorangium sp. So ce327]|jgi:two-component system phosphate regulon sensor histidine kinase PhoR|uniref:HAMP domain-containing sensor histidine kinase n=1 Tax=Sorangium sp. So ce327 TaxID=3133301 RepID=UPI003F644307
MRLPRGLGIGAKLAAGTVLALLVAGVPIERLAARDMEAALLAEHSPRAAVDAALLRSRRTLLLGMGTMIVVAVSVGSATAFFVTRPIRRLTRFAQAMSEGDLSTRAPLRGSGELRQLARALNHLTSELSRSTAEVRTERALLAGILDGMSEGVLVLDRDGRILLANRALRAMASLGEDALGRSVIESIRNARLTEAIQLAGQRDEPVDAEVELGRTLPRRLLVRVSRRKGPERLGHDEREALAAWGADHDGASAEPGLIAVFHDVTDLRRLETIRTDFVANVSHELRTPVTAISTAAETLQLGALKDPDEAAEFVDVIDRHAKRLRHLVDDLLDLSKIEAKNFRLALSELDIAPAIEHVTQLLAEAARRRRVTLTVDASALPPVRCDRRALEQVLMNLLDNAIKYAGEGAHVTVKARSADQQVTLAVVDDGPGIPPHHLGRIFERFYRVDAGRSRDLGGTGLGLAIVKHLVELMNGSIEVESAIGRGTQFTVRLARAG